MIYDPLDFLLPIKIYSVSASGLYNLESALKLEAQTSFISY